MDINSGAILSDLIGEDLMGNKIEMVKTYSGESKVTIFSFFAEWCPNCHYEARQINKLFSNYKASEMKMVLVMDYSPPKKALAFVDKYGLKMPLLFGELADKNEEKRNKTQFYKFKKACGDNRKWGTPFHVILDKENPRKIGIVTGELIEDEIKAFILTTLKV